MFRTNNISSKYLHLLLVLSCIASAGRSQQLYTRGLLKADKQFINKNYKQAADLYAHYVAKHPGDYYASRQAAISYEYVNDYYNACEYWPAVAENAQSNENDWYRYAICLLQNNRDKEAARVLPMLARSKNPEYARWGAAYKNKHQFYYDSASYVINNVTPLNTAAAESCPVLIDNRIFYSIESAENPRLYSPTGNESGRKINVKTVLDTFRFAETPEFEKLRRLPIYSQVGYCEQTNELFFCKAVSNAEANIKSPFPYYKYQLYSVKLNVAADAETQIKEFPYNDMLYNFVHPCVSTDGELLFFSSDMKGGRGGMDIYVSRKVSGEWTAPINLGAKINTLGNELYPRSYRDGSLVFSSDGWPGIGGLDLFKCSQENGIFNTPENMGYPINSRFDDYSLQFTARNKGYFSSNRVAENSADIWFFSHSD